MIDGHSPDLHALNLTDRRCVMQLERVELTTEQKVELKALLENHLQRAVVIEDGCVYEIRADGTIVLKGCLA